MRRVARTSARGEGGHIGAVTTMCGRIRMCTRTAFGYYNLRGPTTIGPSGTRLASLFDRAFTGLSKLWFCGSARRFGFGPRHYW